MYSDPYILDPRQYGVGYLFYEQATAAESGMSDRVVHQLLYDMKDGFDVENMIHFGPCVVGRAENIVYIERRET